MAFFHGSIHGVPRGSIEHLPRVEDRVRVERAAEFAHHAHLGVAHEPGQEVLLRHTHAVFARDTAALKRS